MDSNRIVDFKISIDENGLSSRKSIREFLVCNNPNKRLKWNNIQLGHCSAVTFFINFYNKSATGVSDFHIANFKYWTFNMDRALVNFKKNTLYKINFELDFENGKKIFASKDFHLLY